jgi:hypothetical protein
MGRTEAAPKDYKRALVVMGRQAKRPTKTTLSECNGGVFSKKDLTEPTLLEITDYPTNQDLVAKVSVLFTEIEPAK